MISTPVALGVDVGQPHTGVALPVQLRSFEDGPPNERHQRPDCGRERASSFVTVGQQAKQAARGASR